MLCDGDYSLYKNIFADAFTVRKPKRQTIDTMRKATNWSLQSLEELLKDVKTALALEPEKSLTAPRVFIDPSIHSQVCCAYFRRISINEV